MVITSKTLFLFAPASLEGATRDFPNPTTGLGKKSPKTSADFLGGDSAVVFFVGDLDLESFRSLPLTAVSSTQAIWPGTRSPVGGVGFRIFLGIRDHVGDLGFRFFGFRV